MNCTCNAALAIAMLAGSASAAEVPRDMQGVWTSSALECDALLNAPKLLAKDAQWVKISADRVAGSTTGRVTKIVDNHTIETTGSQVAGVPMVYELRNGSILAETIGDARAATLYLRCAH